MRATCRLFATLHLFWTDPPSPLTGVNFLLGSSIFLASIVLQEALLISNSRARSSKICLDFLHTSVAAGVFRDQGTSVIKQPGGHLNNPECRHEVSSERFIQTLRTSKHRFSCRSALDVSLLWLKYQLHQQQQRCIFWELTMAEIAISHPWTVVTSRPTFFLLAWRKGWISSLARCFICPSSAARALDSDGQSYNAGI